ncbi:MAG: LysR family transcriptional regulator [Proteobacteria bacterium]|jgi:DNA-binding transcriptional LysR family regulator|nr:LysR family transcriptional regulator [Pseudomonadota bacterium]
MDNQSLQTFLTLAEQRSFSRTADAMFITQPAVSKRIAALENELGSRLFDRIGREIRLTEAGQRLLPRAQQILLSIDEAKTEIDNIDGNIAGHLRIGVSHHIGLHRLPPILKEFSVHHPGVELNLEFLYSEEAAIKIQHGELDFAIATLAEQSTNTLNRDIHSTPIWRDPLGFVCATDHPLVTKSKKIDINQLASYPGLLPASTTITYGLVEEILKPYFQLNKLATPTDNLESLKMMVSAGLGWSALPLTMLDEDLQLLDLPQPIRNLGIMRHNRRTLPNAAKAMISLIKSNADTGSI